MKQPQEELKDDSPMPWGKHKGTKMANVPAAYLLFIYRVTYNNSYSEQHPVSMYIHNNLDALKLETNS